jgi:hypothetical protein
MKLLTATDGSLIALAHVVTLKFALDGATYEAAAFNEFKMRKDIERAVGTDNKELEKALTDELAVQFPDGKPRMKDYCRTRVGLSDGKMYWVKEAFEDVRLALLDA